MEEATAPVEAEVDNYHPPPPAPKRAKTDVKS